MDAKLPAELLSQIDARPDEPLPVIDDHGRRFYIVPESRLAHLEALANEESDATIARLRELIADADASPDVPGETVHAELMARAREIDSTAP